MFYVGTYACKENWNINKAFCIVLQKEYEAMKLVNLFDKMVSEGVVKPARVGPDGRPQPIEHVLEFREHTPNRPQS